MFQLQILNDVIVRNQEEADLIDYITQSCYINLFMNHDISVFQLLKSDTLDILAGDDVICRPR